MGWGMTLCFFLTTTTFVTFAAIRQLRRQQKGTNSDTQAHRHMFGKGCSESSHTGPKLNLLLRAASLSDLSKRSAIAFMLPVQKPPNSSHLAKFCPSEQQQWSRAPKFHCWTLCKSRAQHPTQAVMGLAFAQCHYGPGDY